MAQTIVFRLNRKLTSEPSYGFLNIHLEVWQNFHCNLHTTRFSLRGDRSLPEAVHHKTEGPVTYIREFWYNSELWRLIPPNFHPIQARDVRKRTIRRVLLIPLFIDSSLLMLPNIIRSINISQESETFSILIFFRKSKSNIERHGFSI